MVATGWSSYVVLVKMVCTERYRISPLVVKRVMDRSASDWRSVPPHDIAYHGLVVPRVAPGIPSKEPRSALVFIFHTWPRKPI